MSVRRQQKGRNGQMIGTPSHVRRPGSGASSYSSASRGSKSETIDFQRVKDAAIAAKSAFPASKQKVFSTYVEQLESDIKHGNHITYQKIPDRIRTITNFVTTNQQNEEAKPFMDCMNKFSRCLKRGIDELDALKYIKRTEDSTQIKVEGQIAPIEQRPKSSKQRQSSGISEITRALKETQRRLEKRYELIQGEPIPPGFLNDTVTDTDILKNIETLAESFAQAAEKTAPKAETSVLKQKMNQRTKETDMKQFQDEVGSLIAEIQNPTPTIKSPKKPEGELALFVWAARKALSEEKQKKQEELTEIEQETNLLHAALENLQANMTQAKPPNGQLACQIRDAHRKIAEEKSSNQKLQSTVDKQEIEQLQRDIENLDDINYRPQSTKNNSETKLFNGLRKLLASKKKELLRVAEDKEKAADDSVRGMAALRDKIQALWKTLPEAQQSAKEHSELFILEAALGSRDKQIKQLNVSA